MLGGDTGYSFGKAKGVVRLVQVDNEQCVIDGTIDGLSPGSHGLHVHECGDISQGCQRYVRLVQVGNEHCIIDESPAPSKSTAIS